MLNRALGVPVRRSNHLPPHVISNFSYLNPAKFALVYRVRKSTSTNSRKEVELASGAVLCKVLPFYPLLPKDPPSNLVRVG